MPVPLGTNVCSVNNCGMVCKNEKGLRFHISKTRDSQHRELWQEIKARDEEHPHRLRPPDPPDNHLQPSSSQITLRPTVELVKCPKCNQSFINHLALQSHHISCDPIGHNNGRLRTRHRPSPIDSDNNETPTHENSADESLLLESTAWLNKFQQIFNNIDSFDYDNFNSLFTDFSKFLYQCNERISGPVHPNVKYFRWRKKNKEKANSGGTQFQQSSNPQRTDARKRQKRKDRHRYEVAQYLYSRCRKKAVNMVLRQNNSQGRCSIPITDIEAHFRSALETPNNLTLDHYPTAIPSNDITVTIEQVETAIKKIDLDSSPGFDGIFSRTIRELKAGRCIKVIIDIMLTTGTVPTGLTDGKTILLPKNGDDTNIGNWRPISIYSILRRVIERVLDQHLRTQLDLDPNQRGFVSGTPGCHVNAALINACLKDAKEKKSDCVIVFLDVSKAFDRIGHDHIERCLEAYGVAQNLRHLILALLRQNTIRIDTGTARSQSINIRRSVPQGGPLSPVLFNLAIDFIYKEVSDASFAGQHGYRLYDDLNALSLIGFADDQAVISNSVDGAKRIIEATKMCFQKIGLDINPTKSVAIRVKDGKLVPETLQLDDASTIRCIDPEEKIKYLGCSFNDELVWDSRVVGEITEMLNALISSPLLKRDQKLNVINMYILPVLTYRLQAAPRNRIPCDDLAILDRTIRSSIKAIIGLPTSTSTSMIYAPRKYRGLGAVRCEWEVMLQHYSISQKLDSIEDELLSRVHDWKAEMDQCVRTLETNAGPDFKLEGTTSRQLRSALRQRSLEDWMKQSNQGIGVKHFTTFPKANRFMTDKHALSNSEWVAAIKLNFGYANLAGVTGSTHASVDIRCRRCHSEKETPSHVLGSCPFGDHRRNARHHKVKHWIADLLTKKGFSCFDEVTTRDGNNSTRRVDIVAFEPNSNRAYLIDPTVRYETNQDLDEIVQEEKAQIYGTCIQNLQSKYEPTYGNRNYEVIGLWLGARGSISHGMVEFFERFKLDKTILPDIAETVISESIKMIHYHIYSSSS